MHGSADTEVRYVKASGRTRQKIVERTGEGATSAGGKRLDAGTSLDRRYREALTGMFRYLPAIARWPPSSISMAGKLGLAVVDTDRNEKRHKEEGMIAAKRRLLAMDMVS